MPDTQSKLHQFSLGFSDDGRLCRMVFVDDQARSVECLADFNEFTQFVSRLCDAATEMAKRQTPGPVLDEEPYQGIPVASASFRADPQTGHVQGNLVTDTGDAFTVQLGPSLAALIARDLVLALPTGAAN
ncbi:hypothetical protein [Reyranella sp. CPCC 100927]|uniref:hypothetical protein n=1 Tax=Reyranella sp. CPCC 100927 TaxID=2599616 RepID=UPI0011B7F132|nr:hypothetical protein [Reyranella sp. CPCC 100927]TWT02796.1 hypothetical protein FQU96_29260 [Reyranella sp. CPCC 100927]